MPKKVIMKTNYITKHKTPRCQLQMEKWTAFPLHPPGPPALAPPPPPRPPPSSRPDLT